MGNNLTLAEMRKIIEEEKNTAAHHVDDAPVGSEWMTTAVTPNTTEESPDNDDHEESESVEYNGPGLVIDAPKDDEEVPREYTGISPTTQSYIDDYLAEMDEAIENMNNDESSDDEPDEEETTTHSHNTTVEDDFNDSYNEAVVVIDKLGMGQIIDFNAEEREKLTKAKTIKLNEIETVPVNTYAIKKLKDKSSFNKIIKNINNLNTTPICLPLSGYTANIKGCTAYELMGLLETGNNVLLDAQTKWSLIHSKIVSTSIGNMGYNEFLFNTAAADYNNFIYGILCATYPDSDTVTLTCPDCETTHEHTYTVRELIRAERMGDKLKKHFADIIDASVSELTAKKIHETSPIMSVKGIKLPISGIVVELQVQSAYDLINNSIKSISDDNKESSKYRDATIIATLVKRALIPDENDPDQYYEFTSTSEIAQIIYQLRERDILIMRKLGDELMEGMTIEYGFMNIKCPRCGSYIASRDVDPERLLFQRYRQELNATIE